MVLVSLSPFAVKRILLLIGAALILTALRCLADPVLVPVDTTPYDGQMARIEHTLNRECAHSRPIPLRAVNHLMQDLRGIPYGYSLQWKTPAEVANSCVADCKAKAIALYQRLQLSGAQNLRLIIGKRAPNSELTHVWLEWTSASGTYLLDPTFNSKAVPVSKIAPNSYVAYYAFSGERKYRAASVIAVCADL